MEYFVSLLTNVFTLEELIFIFNLSLSMLAGFAIGLERESRGKDAGISTHTLVIIGSMLFTYVSVYFTEGSDSTTRIAAQVVSGIGFIGAGLILKDGTSVRNLTTAASLWLSAAIGMAIGFQFYVVAIFTVFAAIIVLHIPHIFKQKLPLCETEEGQIVKKK
jgi:putative Mg2+ transporter-C (MgtC) family protein